MCIEHTKSGKPSEWESIHVIVCCLSDDYVYDVYCGEGVSGADSL